jgi:hypothetical protein
LKVPEGQEDPTRKIVTDNRFVSAGYFDVMRIPILEGEPCRDAGDSTTAIVNRSFVNQYFSKTPAVGHHLVLGENFPLTGEIRGIARDAREEGLNSEPMPTVYWCMSAGEPDPHYLIRTRGEPMAMAETLRRAVRQVEPSRSVFDLMPLESHLSENFAEGRLRTILLSMFGLTAVSLACIGLYGTLTYLITLRHREIGLRLALGGDALANHDAVPDTRIAGSAGWVRVRTSDGGGGGEAAVGHVVRRVEFRRENLRWGHRFGVVCGGTGGFRAPVSSVADRPHERVEGRAGTVVSCRLSAVGVSNRKSRSLASIATRPRS